jgi:S1-C subfamily serine protease
VAAQPSVANLRGLSASVEALAKAVAAQLPKLRERSGVLVVARDARSPGADDPLTSGDIIHCVNAYAVRSLDGLRAILDGFTSGARIAIQVERGARMRYVLVHLPR